MAQDSTTTKPTAADIVAGAVVRYLVGSPVEVIVVRDILVYCRSRDAMSAEWALMEDVLTAAVSVAEPEVPHDRP